MSVVVYGSSDDLVEIEGEIDQEFYLRPEGDDESMILAFSDGTVLHITYDEQGMWRINRLFPGTASYSKREGTDPDGDYSDRVELAGLPIYWVVAGYKFQKAKHEAK